MKTGENSQRKPVTINCENNRFEAMIQKLKEMGASFITLSTTREEDGKLCLVYFFKNDERMIVLKVDVKDNSVPSLYSSFQKADFIEREINNLFGVKFLGHPNLERIKIKLEKPDEQINDE